MSDAGAAASTPGSGGVRPTLPGGPSVGGDRVSVWLWLSETVIPEAGADIVVLLRGPARASDHFGPVFGVLAAVDVWDGTHWKPHRDASLTLDFWGGVGRLADLGEISGARAIGLGVGERGVGATTLLRLEGLESGRYRLRQSSNAGHHAIGEFEVRDAEVPTVPLRVDDSDRLLVAPTLMSTAGGVLEMSRSRRGNAVESATAIPAEIELQAWANWSWHDVDSVAVTFPDEEARRYGRGATHVPSMSRGAYRLVDRRAADHVQGVFWMTEEPLPAPRPRPDSRALRGS